MSGVAQGDLEADGQKLLLPTLVRSTPSDRLSGFVWAVERILQASQSAGPANQLTGTACLRASPQLSSTRGPKC